MNLSADMIEFRMITIMIDELPLNLINSETIRIIRIMNDNLQDKEVLQEATQVNKMKR